MENIWNHYNGNTGIISSIHRRIWNNGCIIINMHKCRTVCSGSLWKNGLDSSLPLTRTHKHAHTHTALINILQGQRSRVGAIIIFRLIRKESHVFSLHCLKRKWEMGEKRGMWKEKCEQDDQLETCTCHERSDYPPLCHILTPSSAEEFYFLFFLMCSVSQLFNNRCISPLSPLLLPFHHLLFIIPASSNDIFCSVTLLEKWHFISCLLESVAAAGLKNNKWHFSVLHAQAGVSISTK